MHYRTHCCGEHESIKLSKEDDDLSRLIEGYLKQLFDQKGVSQENQKKLWNYYYGKLSKGIDVGYSSNSELYDPSLAHSLKYNIAEFSAFKETSFRKQLQASLVKDGKIVSWNDFKKKADELNIEYNRRWLETEYHQTVATANMAEKWQDFEADADVYPNLKYIAINDKRTREQHRAWDGLILPLNHDFWKQHLPPNDWGCRCTVEQTDEEATKLIPEFKAKENFNNNPAQSGKIFNENAYEKGLSQKEQKEAKKQAKRYFEESNPITLDRYNKIDFEKEKGIKNGGVLEKYTTGSQNKNEEKLNFETFKKLANNGYKYRMLPVLNDGRNNPDGYNLFSNVFADIKNSNGTNGQNIIQNGLKDASKQGASELIVSLKNKLDNNSSIYKGIVATLNQNRSKSIKKIILINEKGEIREFDLVKFREYLNKKG